MADYDPDAGNGPNPAAPLSPPKRDRWRTTREFVLGETTALYRTSKAAAGRVIEDGYEAGKSGIGTLFHGVANTTFSVVRNFGRAAGRITTTAGILGLSGWVTVAGVSGYRESTKPKGGTFAKEFAGALVEVPAEIAHAVQEEVYGSGVAQSSPDHTP